MRNPVPASPEDSGFIPTRRGKDKKINGYLYHSHFNRSYALGIESLVAARSYRASWAAPRRRLRRRGRYDAAATVFL